MHVLSGSRLMKLWAYAPLRAYIYVHLHVKPANLCFILNLKLTIQSERELCYVLVFYLSHKHALKIKI